MCTIALEQFPVCLTDTRSLQQDSLVVTVPVFHLTASHRNHPNTEVDWLRVDYRGIGVQVRPPFGTLEETRMAIEGGYASQSVHVLSLDLVTVSNAGVYVCRDKNGFMRRTLEILQPGV